MRLLVGIGIIALLLPAPSFGEYFRYTDKNGVLHFVDDEGLIPPEYRPAATTHMTEEDRLSPEERAGRKTLREEEALREEQRKSREKRDARTATPKPVETPVTVRGNQVLVPVLAASGGREAELLLLLDTGASRTLIYRRAVESLGLKDGTEALGRVAGGALIKANRVLFDVFRVGPWEGRDVEAFVMDQVGPAGPFDGMLGMDLLGQMDIRVDYARKVIVWTSPPGR